MNNQDWKYIIKRVLTFIFIYIIINILTGCDIVNAETFTQPDRFQYFLYRSGSDVPVSNGTGLINQYGGSGYNRVQFLYNLYTFDSNYIYDITFTVYFDSSSGSQAANVAAWGENCQIYTGTGPQYNCVYNDGIEGNYAFMKSTITNMTGTSLNTLWLNFYTNRNIPVNFIQYSYKLEINRKENKNVTSENLQNATDSIINNNNQNTQNIINNNNQNKQEVTNYLDIQVDKQNQSLEKQDETNQKLDELNNNVTDTNISGANTEAQNMLNAIDATDRTGLSAVITAPLSMVNKLSSGCTPINITIPYLAEDGVIPCMSTSVYNKFPSALVTTVATVVNGFLIYRVIASLYAMVKGFRDPEDDKVEVADL